MTDFKHEDTELLTRLTLTTR